MTSILVLNYNGKPHLQKCLLSIQGFTEAPYELVVIDNGSTDGSQEYLWTVDARGLTVVENPENIGCPPARAQGMALAKGDYIVFLDNDTVVTAGWLGCFIGHCEANPSIGLLGPSTNYISGPQMAPGVKYESGREMADVAAKTAIHYAGVLQPTARLVGFCMFICRAVVDKIGGCDPRFGKYGFEDDDYVWRGLLAGFDARIARDVFIHHTGNRGQVDGGLDYAILVREAWSEFHAKWRLPSTLAFESFNVDRNPPDRPFDPARDRVPLVDRAEQRSRL